MKRVLIGFALWAALTLLAAGSARLLLGYIDWAMLLIIACAAIIALPPEYDPAIQLRMMHGDDDDR